MSFDAFCEWKETKDIMKNGGLKLSDLYRAFNSVGADQTKQLNFDQFNKVLDIIGEKLDVTEFDDDVLTTTEGEELKSFKDREMELRDDATDKEDDDDDRDAVREIFDELKKPGKETIPLLDFIQWDDVQELLSLNALSHEKLALAITNVEASEKSELTFEQFYDLLQIIDTYIDKSKLPDDDDNDDDAAPTLLKDDNEDIDDEMIDELDLSNEEYIQDMFKDLSKGKNFISENVLRKSNDIQEMIDEGIRPFCFLESFETINYWLM